MSENREMTRRLTQAEYDAHKASVSEDGVIKVSDLPSPEQSPLRPGLEGAAPMPWVMSRQTLGMPVASLWDDDEVQIGYTSDLGQDDTAASAALLMAAPLMYAACKLSSEVVGVSDPDGYKLSRAKELLREALGWAEVTDPRAAGWFDEVFGESKRPKPMEHYECHVT